MCGGMSRRAGMSVAAQARNRDRQALGCGPMAHLAKRAQVASHPLNPLPPIEPHDPRLNGIATMPIPAAIKLLERVAHDAMRHRLAGSLGFVWSIRDINLAWNSVTRSALDAPTKQILYNNLWG